MPTLPIPLLCLTVALLAAAPAETGNLELRLQPDQIESGVPQAFTFLLTNKASHDVRVPIPALGCTDSFNGSILLKLEFTPSRPGAAAEGGGCAGDTMNWPPIQVRATQWTVLKAGKTLRFTADRARLHYDAHEPGISEFWAEYSPPSVNRSDAEKLAASGIDYPRTALTTSHIAFRQP